MMPISYSIHPNRGLAHFRMSGTIDVPQTLGSFSDYVQNPQFDPSFVMLTDAQEVGVVDADFLGIVGGVQRAMTFLRSFPNEAFSIIYAPRDLTFGMARIMQQVVEPVSKLRFHILRDEGEALARAGQPETDFNALEQALRPRRATG
ncbi:hypothetical protein [Mameliella sp. MMSF_3510]|uniref:hypothetical protein n=2 Tax=unclassified Mameliella TaxID=2630630 RepID=UPI00273FAD7F|nr:hypothetical protein [Mameliella sp. MMSF_3510]